MSFDEIRSGYDHGFSIVEIESHGSTPVIRTCDVECTHPLVNIPSEGYAEWKDAMKELQEFPAEIDGYIRLNILLKENDLLPHDKEAQILTALKGKKARHVYTNPTRELIDKGDNNDEIRGSLTMEELQAIDPKSILKSHAAAVGATFSEKFDEMFDIVYKIVNGADYEN